MKFCLLHAGTIVQFRKSSWPLNKSTGQRLIYTGLASTESKIFTNTGKKMPKFELKTIDTVVLWSSSDWNL